MWFQNVEEILLLPIETQRRTDGTTPQLLQFENSKGPVSGSESVQKFIEGEYNPLLHNCNNFTGELAKHYYGPEVSQAIFVRND